MSMTNAGKTARNPAANPAASNPLAGKTVLVTGGGRGLGAAICETLARDGALLYVADVDLDTASACAAKLKEAGAQAEPVLLDVGNENSVRKVIEGVVEREGKIDVLVNNAGVDVTLPITELAVQDWERVLRVNLHGPFLTCRYAVPFMQKQGFGHIVNVASTAARRAWPNASAYHASKWGLLGLSQALHAELRKDNIKVTALLAGGMRTPFLLDRFPDIDPSKLQDPSNVAEAVRLVLSMPAESVVSEIMVLPMQETSWP
jgi:NAD(P)-dependent dehydrogenase (short-subunit alcohol dehydrogenase family)